MFNRILFSTFAAAALLTAAPALAADGGSKQPCSCCSDGSIHDVDHPLRQEKEKRSAERKAQPSTTDENPDVRNQSFGG